MILPMSRTVQLLVYVFLGFKFTNAGTNDMGEYNIALWPVRYSLYWMWTNINEAFHSMKFTGLLSSFNAKYFLHIISIIPHKQYNIAL